MKAAFAAPLITILGFLIGPDARATTIIPSDLHTLVRRAGVVFAGTVCAMESEQLEKTIVTRVTFTGLRFAKGDRAGSTITLTLAGGIAGNYRQFTYGQPEFEFGERYVVLAYPDLGSERNSYLPVVGLHQGFFPLGKDSTSIEPVVLDAGMRPVVRIEGHRLVVFSDTPSDGLVIRANEPGTRMTEKPFLEALAQLAAEK